MTGRFIFAIAVAAALSWAPALFAQQNPCPSLPRVDRIERGSLGSNGGRAELDVSLPVVDEPFAVALRGARANAAGCIVVSAGATPVWLEIFEMFFVPSMPIVLEDLFTTDGSGVAPSLLATPALPSTWCGLELVAQAFMMDPEAVGGIASSSAVRLVIGQPSMPTPDVDPLPRATAATTITVTGSATAPGAAITVEGGAALRSGTAGPDRRYAISVPLKPNRLNRLFVHETLSGGMETPPMPIETIQDGEDPVVFIDFPSPDAVLGMPVTNVSGRVADRLSGFLGLEVTVNGQPAVVNQGIGTNGTFDLAGLTLSTTGPTTISVVATDSVGNTVTATARATFEAPSGFMIASVGGESQSGRVSQELPDALEVMVTRPNGTPFANKLVNFAIEKSNGALAATQGATARGGLRELQVFTDAAGIARVFWRLGDDAGCGNNRLIATSADTSVPVFFCASAIESHPSQINVGTGNNQTGAVGAPLGEPFVVWVNDSCNGVPGVPVRFRVIEGSGRLTEGSVAATSSEIVVESSATGHAAARLTLGPMGGVNKVEATFGGLPGARVVFVADALEPVLSATRYAGVVLSNGQEPIGNADCALEFNDGTVVTTVSDVEGQFAFENVPAVGPAHLIVEGASATQLAGRPIQPNTLRFPALEFEVVVHENCDNRMMRPVLLPALDPVNEVVYDTTQTVSVTCDGIEGLEITVPAGTQVRRPDGTLVSPTSPISLSLNQVHTDDLPMPMPDGTDPPFAWTFQPPSLEFDPPLPVQYPNMSSLPAGAVAYFLSFDHDTAKFEIVASASVDGDGAFLRTDPGVGITKSGWGCNCPPYSVTGSCEQCEEVCIDSGSLSGGSVSTSPSNGMACVGDTISFTASGVTDSGGELERRCEDGSTTTMPVPAGAIEYSWTISGPSGSSSGSGATASTTASAGGTYTCTFTAESMRDCPPAPLNVGSGSVEVDALCDCAVEIVGPSGSEFCAGEPITFNAMGNPAGGTYMWSGGTAQGGNAAQSYTTVFSTEGTQTVSVDYECMDPQSGQTRTVSASSTIEIGMPAPLGGFQRMLTNRPTVLERATSFVNRIPRFNISVDRRGQIIVTGTQERVCCPNAPVLSTRTSGSLSGGVRYTLTARFAAFQLPLPSPLNIDISGVVSGALNFNGNGTVTYAGECDPRFEARGTGSIGGSLTGGVEGRFTQYVTARGTLGWGITGSYVLLGGDALQGRFNVSQTGLTAQAFVEVTNPITGSRRRYTGTIVLVSPSSIARFTETLASSF